MRKKPCLNNTNTNCTDLDYLLQPAYTFLSKQLLIFLICYWPTVPVSHSMAFNNDRTITMHYKTTVTQ